MRQSAQTTKHFRLNCTLNVKNLFDRLHVKGFLELSDAAFWLAELWCTKGHWLFIFKSGGATLFMPVFVFQLKLRHTLNKTVHSKKLQETFKTD